jgi:hypothetical protein
MNPAGAVLALLLLLTLNTHAQTEPLDLTLSLRADAWSGTRDLDDSGSLARGSAWGRARLDLAGAGRVVADGWLAAQSHGDADHARLRELYVQGGSGGWDWKVGRQIVTWGRADGINPTDNLSPRDFTLLVAGDNEQRRGNEAAQLGIDTGIGTLSALWFPRAASHTIALEVLPQVSYAVQAAPRRSQWAVKLDMAGEGIDGSVSYFGGHDPMPDLSLQGLGPQGVQVAVQNNPLRVLGVDISLTRGEVVWRAEAAWMHSDSRGADDHARKKPRLWLVAGAERPVADGIIFGLQGSVQRLRNFSSPDALQDPYEREIAWRQAALSNQTAATQLGLVWRLAGRWLNDTLLAEFNGVWLDRPANRLWRTRLSYALNDRVQLQAGSDHTSGPAHSLFGQLRRNRLAFLQMRVTF